MTIGFGVTEPRLITIRVGETRMGLKDAFQATTLTIGSGRKSVGIIWTFGQIRGGWNTSGCS